MNNFKKTLAGFCLLSIGALGVSANGDTSDNNSNGYKDVIEDLTIEFSVTSKNNKAFFEWSNYEHSDFKYYKIVRSETNSNPAYPEDGAIKYLDDNSVTSYLWGHLSPGNAYYRLCVITTEKARYCSKVVKTNFETKADYEKNDHSKIKAVKATKTLKIKYSEKISNSTSTISDNKKEKANLVISNFIKKLDAKYEDNEKKAAIINKIIKRLKALSSERPRIKVLASYINILLEKELGKYEDDFDSIEDIFSDF